MRISTFCEKYKISRQAVYKKIKNHEKTFSGHIKKDKGNVLDLDGYAVALLKPKNETYKALDEQNSTLSQQVGKLSNENESLRDEITEINKIAEHLTFSNLEYEEKHDKYISEIALLTQERDNLKTELAAVQTELSELRSLINQEAERYSIDLQKWNDEKSELTAEISSLELQLKAANKQISDLIAKSEEKTTKNSGIMGLFSR